MKQLSLAESESITVRVEAEKPYAILTSESPNYETQTIWIPEDRLALVIAYLQDCLSQFNKRLEA